MRYIYSPDRLKNMLAYYKDRLTEIREQEELKRNHPDTDSVYEVVDSMLEDLERQAEYEYEYALQNTPLPFWKKAESEIPKPAINITKIYDYVKSKNMKCVGLFPYSMSQYQDCRMFSSLYEIVCDHDGFSVFPTGEKHTSFLVLDPESNVQVNNKIDTLIQRINSHFEKVLDDDSVTPEKYDLNPDEQHILDIVSKFIKDYNDKTV